MLRTAAICACLALSMLAAPAARALSPFFIFFDSGSARLDAQALSILDSAAQGLRAMDARGVVIAGYTDRLGTSSDNLALSRRRAETVRAALIERGTPAAMLTIEALGENQPYVETPDGVSEPRNRVVAIVIQGFCRQLPGMPTPPGC